MANLFIIGNGFDLDHGMKTKYNNFRTYLSDNYHYSCKYGIYIPESVIDNHGEEVQSDNDVVGLIVHLLDTVAPFDYEHQEVDWNNLEYLLGTMNLEECFDTVEEQYDREGDRNYSWEHDVASSVCSNMSMAVPRISEFFSDWIQTVELSNTPKPGFQKLLDNCDDLLLTFNYTRTLETLYHCLDSNVCHIHGVVRKDSFFRPQDFVLGHCGEKDYYNDESLPYEMGPALQGIYEELRKDTPHQISLHQDFFEKIRNMPIDKIYSYGFAFSKVDRPYISKICECLDTRGITWLLHNYDSVKKRHGYQKTIQECGFLGEFGCFDA